jgi:uncharacterized membrane protein YfhO
VPFPGDLLTSWFFPYKSGGWEGYNSWISHKEFILADVVRQIYPWKILSMDLFKNGIIPLWNIYAFAGNPLHANLQAAVFYPLNIIFFLVESRWAWIIYIMVQPILATLFMYQFIRSLKLSQLSAIFAGIGFSFIGYTMVWLEIGVVGHAALWLPFILWGVTRFIDTMRISYLVFSSVGIGCSVLAGHAQTTAYILLFVVVYFLYIGQEKLTKQHLAGGLLVLFLGITLAGIQIVPSIELMSLSPRDAINSADRFYEYIIPPSHIAMLFAPDFFGNPATGNFWGKDYGEFMSYSGIVVLLVGTIGFFTYLKNKLVRLALVTSIVSLLVAFVPFVAELLLHSQIPILGTGIPSRALFLLSFSLTLVSAFGIEAIQKAKFKRIIPPLVTVLVVYVVLWVITLIMNVDPSKVAITQRNLILPTGIILVVTSVILGRKFSKRFLLLWIVIFACMGLEYSYFLNKYLPLAPLQYMFPSHELVTKLTQITGTDRVYGYESAAIETNFPVQWRIQSIEGYDPLYIRNYSELISAAKTGNLGSHLPRSDALLPKTSARDDSYSKRVLLNLLGVKYVLDKDDSMPKKWDSNSLAFSTERFQLIYQYSKWKIYQNKDALPRAIIFYDYTVIPQKDRAIRTLYDKNFPYNQKLILTDAPHISPKSLPIVPASIKSYSANSVTIETHSKQSGLLFLSDNNYPGWNAFVDNHQVPILLADYSFRAVEIPEGNHTVKFEYRPLSFYVGAAITIISAVFLMLLFKKKLHITARKKKLQLK